MYIFRYFNISAFRVKLAAFCIHTPQNQGRLPKGITEVLYLKVETTINNHALLLIDGFFFKSNPKILNVKNVTCRSRIVHPLFCLSMHLFASRFLLFAPQRDGRWIFSVFGAWRFVWRSSTVHFFLSPLLVAISCAYYSTHCCITVNTYWCVRVTASAVYNDMFTYGYTGKYRSREDGPTK